MEEFPFGVKHAILRRSCKLRKSKGVIRPNLTAIAKECQVSLAGLAFVSKIEGEILSNEQRIKDTNDAEEFLNAIKQAAKADYFSEYVVLVLDNAAIHTKEMVRWLWMEHRVLAIFLPTRSPECNILN